MVKSHLKRIATPKSWPIKKKENKFIIRPRPGPHTFKLAIPLNLILKNLIKNVKTTKEVKYILNNKDVFINNKIRRDHKFLVGLMDVVSIPLTEEYYRVLIDKKGKLFLLPIKEKESKTKICKIKSKNTAKKGLIQLGFSNGETMLVNKKDYKTGDVVVINCTDNSIINLLKLEKGALVYIIDGKKVGEMGKVEEITDKEIIIRSKNKKLIQTSKKYALVIGKEKPVISLEATK